MPLHWNCFGWVFSALRFGVCVRGMEAFGREGSSSSSSRIELPRARRGGREGATRFVCVHRTENITASTRKAGWYQTADARAPVLYSCRIISSR